MLGLLVLLSSFALSLAALRSTFSSLGLDPPTVNRLNGESFQQSALVSFKGYQYAAFYGSAASANVNTTRHVSVARRKLSASSSFGGSSNWEILTLTDYNQTLDDGHDIVSMGLSEGDGTIHLGFDQHDNNLNYRVSRKGVALDPENVDWNPSIFGDILNILPGLESLDQNVFFINVTYPRFLSLPGGDMLMEFRVGRSGLGDDWLYGYSSKTGDFTLIGRYLEGVNNNAYINGIDIDSRGVLQVTWTYRDFVNDTGQDVAVEAGPNGPENNHDLNYAYSQDLGKTWQNNWGQVISRINGSSDVDANNNTFSGSPITPASAGIVMFGIPKFGGILNQEAQTIDSQSRIHVLNRENTTGTELWYHYWRSTTIDWTRTPLPESVNNALKPTVIGKRGKVLSSGENLYMLLPSNAANSTALSLIKATAAGHYRDWSQVWDADEGCTAEPVFDHSRLAQDGVLSVLVVNGTEVGVLDIDLRD